MASPPDRHKNSDVIRDGPPVAPDAETPGASGREDSGMPWPESNSARLLDATNIPNVPDDDRPRSEPIPGYRHARQSSVQTLYVDDSHFPAEKQLASDFATDDESTSADDSRRVSLGTLHPEPIKVTNLGQVAPLNIKKREPKLVKRATTLSELSNEASLYHTSRPFKSVDIASIKRGNFPVHDFTERVRVERDDRQNRRIEKKIQYLQSEGWPDDKLRAEREQLEAEAEAAKTQSAMCIPSHMGIYIPDKISGRVSEDASKKQSFIGPKTSPEMRTDNILKPYKWYQVERVIIDKDDHDVIKDSNRAETLILRIGFVFLIVAVLTCIVLFAIYYTRESATPEYEATKQTVVGLVKFGITVWMGALMYVCNETTNARDGVLANHLKTAVDVVRRVEKERWCANRKPIALEFVPEQAKIERSMGVISTV